MYICTQNHRDHNDAYMSPFKTILREEEKKEIFIQKVYLFTLEQFLQGFITSVREDICKSKREHQCELNAQHRVIPHRMLHGAERITFYQMVSLFYILLKKFT